MDAREREESQSYRPNIKRPWEEITIIGTESNHGWKGRLPPIEAVSYGVPSPRAKDHESGSYDQYRTAEAGGETAKRARYDRHDYSILSQENLDLNGKILQAQSSISAGNPIRASLDSPAFSQAQKSEGWEERRVARTETAGPPNTHNLCRRCRRLTTQLHDAEVSESCVDCSGDSGLASAMKEAAATLTKLAIKLSPSEQRDEAWVNCPPIAQVGLKQSFNWILNRIHLVSDLADKVLHHVPAELSNGADRDPIGNGSIAQDDPIDNMKRHLDPASEEALRSRNDSTGATSDAKPYTRRRSLAPVEEGNDPFSTLRSLHGYRGSPLEADGTSLPIMNPPPAPSRQLPSPSPTSISFPSPSVASYGSVAQPPPLSIHHSSINTYLPPIGPTQNPDALQTHSAALQHEVSVQKLALSSLQGEHDKLLAAFSRSQLRASTLEKKHAVSDNEINMLSEEKLKLQNQVQELEKDVEELTRSRDETRQAAVLEGAQYMEIVKKASRLEELAGEERKRWNELRAEMEQKIESLSAERGQEEERRPNGLAVAPRTMDGVLTPTSSAGAESILKVEPRPAIDSIDTENDPNRILREEVHRLRARCTEVEGALRAIRKESQSMGGILEALTLMRRSTTEQACKVLGDTPDDGNEGEVEEASQAAVQ